MPIAARTRRCRQRLLLLFVALAMGGGSATRPSWAEEPGAAKVDFDRQIRPLLSEHCFQCHGPDRMNRQADLRLDTQEGAIGSGQIVPGDVTSSEVFRRITSDDPDERMPPPESSRTLNKRQIALIRSWIEAGAPWRQHWAFTPPKRPSLPTVQDGAWPRNGVDRFVLSRLEAESLSPALEADKTTLIRRVSLDLTGLPPSPAEVDAFLADDSPDAYERLVDRLLASPRYGERMATPWLDAARFADTSGYQSDGPREMWRWRDWVIDALNAGMPFDQFTIEQVAGDLLPNATLEQRVATGFNRNHRGNAEGGIIPEEYAVEYVVDRIDTTATTWLGLTMACCRCHDHKYDPLTQRDFYQLFAYFNNIPEHGRALKEGNSPPTVAAPTYLQRQRLAELEAAVAAAKVEVAQFDPQLRRELKAWAKSQPTGKPIRWSLSEGLAAHFSLDEKSDAALDGEAELIPGRLDSGVHLDGKAYLDVGDRGAFGYTDKFTLSAWIRADDEHGGTIVSRMTDVPEGDGYSFELRDGRLRVHLVKRWLDDAIRVESVARVSPAAWHHVAMTYDGSRVADGIAIYLDGRPVEIQVELDYINQSFANTEPLRIGAGGGPAARFRGAIDDVRVFNRALSPADAAVLATAQRIDEILATPLLQHTPAARDKLRRYYLESAASPAIQRAHERLAGLQQQRRRLIDSFPTVMVMEEMSTPRETRILHRGAYDAPGESVAPSVPASLPAAPAGAPANRLGLAQWLVDDSNPLTARVVVNRYWQVFFGEGLVPTSEDFGIQGERPSHPELLDWLATEMQRTGWNGKRIHRLIVTSSTYRQSSQASPQSLAADPQNRLLSRGPRRRLSAQMVRDQALAASGLLVEHLGGPSVLPYQPAGLWEEVSGAKYEQDHGEKLYRRSLYTYFKRTAAPPGMIAFDAAGRETCTVRPARTNTPLQALVTLNDVTFVEAARVLAERVMEEAGDSPEQRVERAFRLVLSRRPTKQELSILTKALRHHEARFRSAEDEARRFVAAGESPVAARHDVAELAALATVTELIFNLDEALTNQ